MWQKQKMPQKLICGIFALYLPLFWHKDNIDVRIKIGSFIYDTDQGAVIILSISACC